MIITSMIAENFRKYAHLQLDNLPDRGLIALTGGNESGKSSIGDAIQFGLFGHTDQVKPASPYACNTVDTNTAWCAPSTATEMWLPPCFPPRKK